MPTVSVPAAGTTASARISAARDGPGDGDVHVIFGATGDLAKIETFATLVGPGTTRPR